MDDLTSIQRLTRDLRDAAITLSDTEARFLTDAYYTIQEDRKRSGNQILAMENEPHSLLQWFFDQNATLEAQLKGALDKYSSSKPIGQWMKSQYGIGPVIAAGLMAHIDIKKAPTAGHIWSFAGLDDEAMWLGSKKAGDAIKAFVKEKDKIDAEKLVAIARGLDGSPKWLCRRAVRAASGVELPFKGLDHMTDEKYVEVFLGSNEVTVKDVISALSKRPWNASLKTLCWHIGQSFMKFSNRDDCFYGKLYRQQKMKYVAKNENGDYADQAAKLLPKFDKATEAYGHLKGGKLPPAQIDARARRWVVKIFLAHVHDIWWELDTGTPPPSPYPIKHLGHVHVIEPPNKPIRTKASK